MEYIEYMDYIHILLIIFEITQHYKYIEIESNVNDILLSIAAFSYRVYLSQADTLSSA